MKQVRLRETAGFTLLELQVAIALLLLGVAGMAALVMTDLKQLEWLEKRHQLQAYVPADHSRIVFTELASLSRPNAAAYRVKLKFFNVAKSTLAAIVILEERP